MQRKKVDERVRTLIENGAKTSTRSCFVIVGDRGKDQVANLHYILTKAQLKARPSVLWCYNKELGFSTHRQKRMKAIKKMQAKGLYDREKEDPFEMFISSTTVRWCYYKETQRILGNTYGMAVLQDFEAVTPNILCRTIETVEGGGMVILLLRTMNSLRQLYTLAMEAHTRFRTEAHGDIVARFNERFLLSLASCSACLVLDDELNVLPISRHARALAPLPGGAASGIAAARGVAGEEGGGGVSVAGGVEAIVSPSARELGALKTSLAGTELVGALVNATRTLDQARAVLTFCESIADKTLRSTVALTAGRGRGKSAALGLAIAAAVGYGYSNIFVTSPSPENLNTLFEFVFKGLEALAFREHLEYEAVASTTGEWAGSVVRVNIFRGHRQTIQYVAPTDADRLGSAELLVVDEAAAIPLPIVKKLLGPYLVFLASTVNGYEGTGRSLSLKLVQQLRQQQLAPSGGTGTNVISAGGAGSVGGAAAAAGGVGGSGGLSGRTFREVSLNEPIRYAAGDPVEKWLNELLCLDATTPPKLTGRLPPPSACGLYAVDRGALFSYHRISEAFLHRMMSLYVSSHYKNTPNDLQLLADAPAHRLFVLLGPHADLEKREAASGAGAEAAGPLLPDVLCVVQVCLEGRISADSVRAQLSRGVRSSGDLIPWTLSQQFQDDGFAALSGARVVRIATHPDASKMGYGSKAIELLARFYEGKLVTYSDDVGGEEGGDGVDDVDAGVTPAGDEGEGGGEEGGDVDEGGASRRLHTERLRPRKELPPLLVPVGDLRRPPHLHWLGVSFGLTLPLFNFWRKGGYQPVYLRQTANEVTAENTCVMLKPLHGSSEITIDRSGGSTAKGGWGGPQPGWQTGFVTDFASRFASLLSFPEFRALDLVLALSVLDAATGGGAGSSSSEEGGSAALLLDTPATAEAEEGAASRRGSSGRALSTSELGVLFSSHDLARLDAYARGQVDYHLILDLVPAAARVFFGGRLPTVHLPRVQSVILLALGLQRSSVDATAVALALAPNQVLALFAKTMRKIGTALSGVVEAEVSAALDAEVKRGTQALAASMQSGGRGGAGAPAANGEKGKSKGATAAVATAAPTLSAAAVKSLLADDEIGRYVVPDDAAFDKELGGSGKRAKRRLAAEGGVEGEGAESFVPPIVSIERPSTREDKAGGGDSHHRDRTEHGGKGGKKHRLSGGGHGGGEA